MVAEAFCRPWCKPEMMSLISIDCSNVKPITLPTASFSCSWLRILQRRVGVLSVKRLSYGYILGELNLRSSPHCSLALSRGLGVGGIFKNIKSNLFI